jgi:CO dehydrogenase maturation factor
MIVGLFGKGGSGKSTLATALVRRLHERGNIVLAVDADHNMDLSYNLGVSEHPRPIGGQIEAIKAHLGIEHDTYFGEAVMTAYENALPFSLTPPDPITERFSIEIVPRLRLMQTGPQTDHVVRGLYCSHYLSTPLKVYLPLLSLGEDEWVVVDEKASADAVTTGIPTGMDVAVVVAEPREHSMKVAQQILSLLATYEIPAIVVGNKVRNEQDHDLLSQTFSLAAFIPFCDDKIAHEHVSKVIEACEKTKSSVPRLKRSQHKFELNKTFATQQS